MEWLHKHWSNTVTLICIVVTAFVEAWQQATNNLPAASNLPRLQGGWNYVPFALVSLAGILQIVAVVTRRKANTSPSRTPPRLKIIEAHYGIEGINDPDVTQYLLERAHADYLAESVGGDVFGGFDPVPGAPKRLKIRYSFDGKETTIERPEYSWLILPEDLFLKQQIDALVNQLKVNQNQYNSDLNRVRESGRQCEENLRESANRNLEYKAKLAMFSALQWDALQLSTVLLDFLKALGPEPLPKYSRDQIARMSLDESRRLIEAQDGDYSEACAYHDGDQRIFSLSADSLYRGMQHRHTRLRPWYEKLRASYALELKSKVEEIHNRFAIEGLSDGDLLLPVQDFNGVKNVQAIASKLWSLAYKLEERKRQDVGTS